MARTSGHQGHTQPQAAQGRRPCTTPRGTLTAILAAVLTTTALAALGAYPLEIIDLKARLPEDVIPSLEPLAGADGVVTGSGHSLFIRAAPERLADIRRALSRLDTPARSLLIQVRRSGTARGGGTALGARVDEAIGDWGRLRIGARPPGSMREGGSALVASAGERAREMQVSQEVRALDGRPAFIATGTERPEVYRERTLGPGGVHTREGVSYRQAETGFYVTPRVNGDLVTLDIAAFSAQPAERGVLNTGEVQTSVTARLGEWIAIGGAQSRETRDAAGLIYRAEAGQEGQMDLELRVIEVP